MLKIKNNIFQLLLENPKFHQPDSKEYKELKKFSEEKIKPLFLSKDKQSTFLEPFGDLIFPYHEMGAVSTINLFDLDELILFAFYSRKKGHYKSALDLGANVGLHSIIMSKCGFKVKAFEPDPTHFKLLTENVGVNCSDEEKPELFEAAISVKTGKVSFVRVHGNTMSSHISGMKNNAYGELSEFDVRTVDIKEVISGVDFIKMDVEGHEVALMQRLNEEDFLNLDIMMEIGSEVNRDLVFKIIGSYKLNCFSQKTGWQLVKSVVDLPKSYKEGSVFLTKSQFHPWL